MKEREEVGGRSEKWKDLLVDNSSLLRRPRGTMWSREFGGGERRVYGKQSGDGSFHPGESVKSFWAEKSPHFHPN